MIENLKNWYLSFTSPGSAMKFSEGRKWQDGWNEIRMYIYRERLEQTFIYFSFILSFYFLFFFKNFILRFFFEKYFLFFFNLFARKYFLFLVCFFYHGVTICHFSSIDVELVDVKLIFLICDKHVIKGF